MKKKKKTTIELKKEALRGILEYMKSLEKIGSARRGDIKAIEVRFG